MNSAEPRRALVLTKLEAGVLSTVRRGNFAGWRTAAEEAPGPVSTGGCGSVGAREPGPTASEHGGSGDGQVGGGAGRDDLPGPQRHHLTEMLGERDD
ncbi:MAG: hypothetical protein WB020_08985 [Candidatus Dormiibacterota bacterium]